VLLKSGRNLPNCLLELAPHASAYDVANSDVLLMTRAAVDRVKESFQHEK
jgi:ribosomal protein L4